MGRMTVGSRVIGPNGGISEHQFKTRKPKASSMADITQEQFARWERALEQVLKEGGFESHPGIFDFHKPNNA
jgi:hypothetical protein